MNEFRRYSAGKNALSDIEYYAIIDELSDAEKFNASLLLSALNDDDPVIRCYAARKLGLSGRGSQDIAHGLAEALKDNYATVRQYASAALGILDPPPTSAIYALKLALDDVDPVVREFSGASLLAIEKQIRKDSKLY